MYVVREYSVVIMSAAVVILLVLLFIRHKFFKQVVPAVFETAMAQSIGKREIQSDYVGIECSQNGCIGIVVDGAGRGRTGQTCAEIVFKTFFSLYFSADPLNFNPAEYFYNAISLANRKIADYLNGEFGGVSATIVIIEGDKLYYAAVGDCAVAVFRGNEVVILNEGHTTAKLAEKQYLEGKLPQESALKLLSNKKLYNYIGMDQVCEFETANPPVLLKESDVVVVASDGAYRGAGWGFIEDVLNYGGSCDSIVNAIIKQASLKKYGDSDNASVILVRKNSY